jgi:hypothetical protein
MNKVIYIILFFLAISALLPPLYLIGALVLLLAWIIDYFNSRGRAWSADVYNISTGIATLGWLIMMYALYETVKVWL